MKRKGTCLWRMVVGVMFISSSAFAQGPPKVVGGPAMEVSPAFKLRLDPLGSKLGSIENILSRVEGQKLVTERDSEDLGRTMFEYAEGMKAAFDVALKEAELAASSKGKQGSVGSLKHFEDTAKGHEARLKSVEAKTQAFEAHLKTGVIKLDRPILQKLTPGDRGEFQRFLTPQGLQEMQKLHPELFKGIMGPQSSLKPFDGTQVAGAVAGFCRAVPEELGNLFVSPAEAALAAPCIGSCLAQNWSACTSCIVGKGPAAISAWNKFVGKWNGCGKCWKPWTWWCKAKALAALIAKLA